MNIAMLFNYSISHQLFNFKFCRSMNFSGEISHFAENVVNCYAHDGWDVASICFVTVADHFDFFVVSV